MRYRGQNNMRYLTKTRFKLGIECPTKLFYTGKKDEYPDQSLEDEFLSALADGGFQVGELARKYYKGGINIETLEPNEAEAMTQDLMKQDRVIMFEPAVRYNNLLIRIDILVKDGQNLRLIEVKSKSFDNSEANPFLTKAGKITSGWEPYLQDIAFQKYVLEKACPEYKVTSYLMMADKNVPCPVDGLNQKFRIIRIKKDSKDRKRVKVTTSLTEDDLSRKILIEVPVDDYVRLINEGTYDTVGNEMSFAGRIDFLSDHYEKDHKISPVIGAKCRACEFRCTGEDEAKGLKSGFKKCWTEVLKWKDSDFDDPSILELWNFPKLKKDSYISSGKAKMKDMNQDDIEIKASSVPGLSSSERQWLQIEKVKNKDTSAYFDSVGMKAEMAKWTFPLHHIDFETAMVAIPFIKGRKPYEGIIFQFSHHVVHKDGIAEHAGQYLNASPGVFPNYESIRELKRQLENDNGTIFRYATHENTYLLEVYRQLIDDPQPQADRDALCEFIKTITKSDEWTGKRSMVDLCELVKKYYYDPSTHGSNSIKKVLPAIMNSSSYLQEKYAKPLYGKADGIKSLNYADWVWVKVGKDGRVIDPYSLLPPVFNEDTDESIEPVGSVDEELKDGGAAMTAYSRMQFTEMNDYERSKLKSALLKYCELDTFAMVMICEAWREMLV